MIFAPYTYSMRVGPWTVSGTCGVGVTVDHHAWCGGVDPVAEYINADVCRIAGVIVDPRRGAVGDKNIGGVQLVDQIGVSALGVQQILGSVLVPHAAL